MVDGKDKNTNKDMRKNSAISISKSQKADKTMINGRLECDKVEDIKRSASFAKKKKMKAVKELKV